MRIVLDHSVPAPLRHYLRGHEVRQAKELGWDRLANGELLKEAESAGVDLLITADKNLQYQQDLRGRRISLIIVGNAQWPVLRRSVDKVLVAVDDASPGSFAEVPIPYE